MPQGDFRSLSVSQQIRHKRFIRWRLWHHGKMREWKGFHKGVNLGGWLSQCRHTEEHYAEFVREEDIERVSKWGIDHLRVPVDYDLVEDEQGNPRESGFAHLQDAIDWCRKYGLNMILDLHKTAGFSFDKGENETGFFDSEAYQERFYRLWEKFASLYGKYEDMLAFELLNEVTDKEYCEAWNRISTECIRRIRRIAPTIFILVGGYYNNSAEAVKDLAMPADEGIVYNFHCYEPVIFTHQGAYWVDGMDTSFRISLSEPVGTLAEKTREQLSKWPASRLEKFPADQPLSSAYFVDLFAEAVQVAKERKVPLYCGEYGVIDRTAPEEILAWYKLINPVFEQNGIGRAAWSYKQMDFGLSDSRMDGVREELLKYL